MKACYKVWLESENGKFILGEGTADLLHAVEEKGSISEAARQLHISYAHAWRKIRTIEKNSGRRVLERTKGGKTGGSSELTDEGKVLLQKYDKIKDTLEKALH
ncbi:MAG: LysR family transcriptional regulator [Candidatus Thorarchaeota archaeon]|jgi:molybdate transport repressor ModE-like protein